MKCPTCGRTLTPVSLDPDTPPWVCNYCARGYWNAELRPDAIKDWDPTTRTWGDPKNDQRVLAACEKERQQAWGKK